VTNTPSTILLNRGFIPNPQAVAIRQGHEPPPNLGEEIVVEGYLSKLNGQGWSPENEPERGEWFWKDVERMADWAGGEEKGVQPVLVDVIDRMPYSHWI
jgi:surfeit locus 1 family protein